MTFTLCEFIKESWKQRFTDAFAVVDKSKSKIPIFLNDLNAINGGFTVFNDIADDVYHYLRQQKAIDK